MSTEPLPPIADQYGVVIPLYRNPIYSVQAPRDPEDRVLDDAEYERDFWVVHFIEQRDRAAGWQVIALTAICVACPLVGLLGFLVGITF